MNSTVKKYKRVIEKECNKILSRLRMEFSSLYDKTAYGLFNEVQLRLNPVLSM